MTELPPRIAIFGGSLRSASFNTRLLEAFARAAEPLCELERLEVAELPFYDQDLDPGMGGHAVPEAAERFRAGIDAAHGVIIVSPEYSWTIPGYIKNAIDWVSRPAFDCPLTGKPALLAGASAGPAGTGRAQLHMRQSLVSTRTPVLLDDLQVPFAQTKIEVDGTLEPALEARIGRLVGLIVDEAARARDEDWPGRLRIELPPEVSRGEVVVKEDPR